jgi:hypothetical protein
MVEIFGHHRKAAPMREPVGVQADQDRAADRKQAEARPGGDERQKVAPAERMPPLPLRAGHQIDDAAKQ